MRIDVISIFPRMFDALVDEGVTARAVTRGLWSLHRWNPRDLTEDQYHRVDDRPYGGGPGMVMMAAPLARTLAAVRQEQRGPLIFLSPQGAPLVQRRVAELSRSPGFVLLAGRYEAVDQRFIDEYVDEEVSIGDFVVSGGELPAMMLIDAVVRLLPGALGDPDSALQESFAEGVLDCPHYTRPEVLDGYRVPPVLLSGDHAAIGRWRREAALVLTAHRRPDLIAAARVAGRLSADDERVLREHAQD